MLLHFYSDWEGTTIPICSGRPYPLDVYYDDYGINFALYSDHDEKQQLIEYALIYIKEQTHQIWHIYLSDFEPGQIYAYSVDDPFDPQNGDRFNVIKLLIDPYVRAITGILDWHDSLFGYNIDDDLSPDKDLTFNIEDSAPYIPKCVVIDSNSFNWVKKLHKAGIKVILDVTYNHTGEGNRFRPTLSFKGIDNRSYYRLSEHDRRYYFDYTGAGNTLICRLPNVLRLIMDSLRYWILDMYVGGFRFDLATIIAHELHAVDRLSAFFEIIHQDPVIGTENIVIVLGIIGVRFTLNDLVSYNEKHNHRYGEDNFDGESYNRSWNCGIEGTTNDVHVNAFRDCQERNFSNNIVFITRDWLNWNKADQHLLEFTQKLISL
ncbi:unnamed protein product [Rotaria sordida]|uniref:Glycoside hydrolase family 13 N-terminal domain-containing protein n=1 Tax=Rotaria sordida TaxID=392033 RepID=A0A815MDA3_9BILA|nr:unnamed protein product [Rotaria sordida]CAF1416620.1 unnamed protein product [Rotaria sordida]